MTYFYSTLKVYASKYPARGRPGILCVCFSPDDRYLIFGDTAGQVAVLSRSTFSASLNPSHPTAFCLTGVGHPEQAHAQHLPRPRRLSALRRLLIHRHPRNRVRLSGRDGAGLEHARRLRQGLLRQQPRFLVRQVQPRRPMCCGRELGLEPEDVGCAHLSDGDEMDRT